MIVHDFGLTERENRRVHRGRVNLVLSRVLATCVILEVAALLAALAVERLALLSLLLLLLIFVWASFIYAW
jgi:hypothetical protein